MTGASRPAADTHPLQSVRLDVWLDVACLFRTRSEAQRAAKGGKVEINGRRGKPHREIRPGDEIRITRPNGVTQVVSVAALAEHHLPKADARRCTRTGRRRPPRRSWRSGCCSGAPAARPPPTSSSGGNSGV